MPYSLHAPYSIRHPLAVFQSPISKTISASDNNSKALSKRYIGWILSYKSFSKDDINSTSSSPLYISKNFFFPSSATG